MPASTLESVNEALRMALGKSNEGGESRDLDAQLAGSTKKALLANIEFEPAGSYQSTVLDVLKSKYIVLKTSENAQQYNSKSNKQENDQSTTEETLKPPKKELYPLESIQLGWGDSGWSVGAGMVNMGNTCYLNSTLQALFHVPSLVNWLISDKEHAVQCQDSGALCIICAMRKTLNESQQRNISSIRPILIYNKLRLVCRNLIPGRQEDAHEFLRYLVEAMEKSYIQRFKNFMEFDSKVKETTPLNQILGGYLRSAVRCLRCAHVSTTFQHFQDLMIDIRKAQTLSEALESYFSREKLDDESYHCEACQKKVPATKQFSLERAPMVLCIQLKRFSVSNNKLTKHLSFKQRLDLTRFSRQRPGCPLIYKLVALVTHMGPTVSCGHYTAVALAPSGNYYQFDDSMVRQISHQNVFNTNAYIMLYELEQNPYARKFVTKAKIPSTVTESSKAGTSFGSARSSLPSTSSGSTTSASCTKLINGIGFTSDKVYGPELPPERVNGGPSVTSTATSKENKEKQKAVSSSYSKADDSSASSDLSEEETSASKGDSPPALVTKEADSSTANDVETTEAESGHSSPTSTTVPSKMQPNSTSRNSVSTAQKNSSPSKSLVPYDTGDTSGSEDSNHSDEKVTTKATAGDWQVTSSTDITPHRAASNTDGVKTKTTEFSNSNNANVVSELYKMSNSGYSAQVFTWNGTKTQLDKEVNNEKREDRKRHLSADSSSIDQGRTKHPKVSSSFGGSKSNPGYNPVQEYHNMKNWNKQQNNNGNSSGGHQHFKYFNSGNRHRRNFHHKGGGNYHKNNNNGNNNYRFR